MKCAEFWQAMHAALNRLPPRVAQVFMIVRWMAYRVRRCARC